MDLQIKLFILALFSHILVIISILIIMLVKRLKAVKAKEINPAYFKTYDGGAYDVPHDLRVISNHYNLSFQMPLLFIITGVLIISLKLVNPLFTVLAWLFVIFKAAHTYIHLGKNYVPHRYTIFGLCCFVLALMWFYLVGKIFLLWTEVLNSIISFRQYFDGNCEFFSFL